jgi:hypothetical protein
MCSFSFFLFPAAHQSFVQIILVAQEDRDPALLKLFEKLSTCFNTQDEMLDQISLMQAAMPGKIS